MEREMEYTRQRNLSNTSEERTMFVIDDTSQGGQEASPAPSHHYNHHHRHQQQQQPQPQPQPLQSSRLCEPPDLSLAPPPRNLLQQQQQQQQQQPSSSSSGNIGHYHQQEASAEEQQQQYYQQHVLQQQQPLQQQKRRRNSAIQCDAFSIANSGSAAGAAGGGGGRPRRQRRPSEFVDTYRRYSTSSGRPRANSVARPTPLGDGRRSSTCKRPSTGSVSGGPSNRTTRRASNAAGPISSHRRDSVRPTRSPSGQLLEPASLEALQQLHSQSQKKKHSRQEDLLDDLEKNDGEEEEDERSPRQRRIASILLGTFLFILAASVLAVVVTLTHSSFHQPPIGSRELQEHRANFARRTRSY